MTTIQKIKADAPNKTIVERIWDWKKQYWFRAKMYLPNGKLDRVLSVNVDELNKNWFVTGDGAYFFDKTNMLDEKGIQKALFIDNISDQIVKVSDNGVKHEIDPTGGQVTIPYLKLVAMDAKTFLQRLQTEWGREMFKGGVLSKIQHAIGIAILLSAGSIAISAIALMKIMSM